MATTRLKFQCGSVTSFGVDSNGKAKTTVKLIAMLSEKENKVLWDNLPGGGTLELALIGDVIKFAPGKWYFIDVVDV